MKYRAFEDLFQSPLRNGLTKPKRIRGEGYKMVNMGELFRFSRISNIEMDRVPLNSKEYSSFLLERGDLLFARQSLVLSGAGQCSIFIDDDEDVCFESHLIRCRLDHKIANPLFYYYFFSSHLGKQAIYAITEQGAGAAGVRGSDLAKVLVPDVEIQTQNEIVEILNTMDCKIELNRKKNQTLEQIAQALFKSWFVDFDPVKAKMESLAMCGSPADAELAAMSVISAKTVDELNSLKENNPEAFTKLQETAALFPSAMQESELGLIPEGWRVDYLGDHLTVLQTGSRPKGGVGGIIEGVPSVGAENILGVGKYTYGKEKFVSREFFEKLKRGVIEDFDFLLYKDGGRPGEFKPRVSMFGCGFPYSEFAINEHVFRMRSESLGQAFLYFQIGHKRVLDELANRGGKAAIPGINQTDVKTIPIIVPDSSDVLKRFDEFSKKILESILKTSNESNQLATVRDSLLPKLLSGEIDLSSEAL